MSQIDPFMEEFLALYEAGGVAYGIEERSRGVLLGGKGAESPHEIGYHRGVLRGLESLRNNVVELAKRDKEKARQAEPETPSSPTNRPLRRVM